MASFFDIHSHILPDIEGDDGSRSMDMTLQMLRMAAEAGTTDIVATPHVNRRETVPRWEDIKQRVQQVQDEADKAQIPIHIYAGAEVEMNYKALEFLPKGGKQYCLNETPYILAELTEQSQVDQTEQLLFELMLRGYIPILAHPERYTRIMHHPNRVLQWMQRGVLTQCNMGSFVGAFGEHVQQRAENLLRHHMVVFVGSDAHRTDWRTPDQRKGQMQIQKLGGSLDVYTSHAAKLLQGKPVYPPDLPAEWKEKKRGFFARLFHGN